MGKLSVEQLREKTHKIFPELVDVLKDFVAIPSISSQSFDQKHVQNSAEFVLDLFQKEGFEAEILTAVTNDCLLYTSPSPRD